MRTSHKIEPNIYRRELLSCIECDFVAGSKFILKHHYKTNHKMERFRDAVQCCREIHFDSGYTKLEGDVPRAQRATMAASEAAFEIQIASKYWHLL